jgi:exodeoxyribonuclease VII large subunit
VRAIATSRVPVISAVGHEVDVTLADLAADLRALTPSEAAERAVPVEADLVALLGALSRRMERALRTRLEHLRRRLDLLHRSRGLNRPLERVRLGQQRLDELAARLTQAPRLLVARLRERLGRAGARLEALDPRRVLERGYSMTLKDGAVVRSVAALRPGDRVTTWLSDGAFTSEVGEVHGRPG